MRGKLALAGLTAALLLTAPLARPAHAQKPADVEVDRGPAAELYIRKRPSLPEAPVLSAELKELLTNTEKRRDDKRLQAIGLLHGFLDTKPSGESRADGMFKLAELLWEEARRQFLLDMDTFSRDLEACHQVKGGCAVQPKEPRINLTEAEGYYKTLHDEHPDFHRLDLVTYLLGFAAHEAGREDDAMGRFEEVIARFPRSPLYGDAWMQVGEHYFGVAKWQKARDAYKNILADKTAATYDLAMFKTAWCDWKLGDVDTAARRFKEVLDLAVDAERSGTEAQRRRRASLRDEALEYLVVVFTEDRSISAKEVFDFLASIGGERYSRDVLLKVAESYAGQAEWERSNEAYRFLIKMEPEALKAADYQRQIVANWNSALDAEKAQDEIKVLLDGYGPASGWAKAQRNKEALARSLETTEGLVRLAATNLHGEAQRREKADCKAPKHKDGDPIVPLSTSCPKLVPLYARAADAYDLYLGTFGATKGAPDKAIELRYYRADILYFKLGKLEEAGDEYLAVGKSAPVGKWHKDALRNAMDVFEAARPKDTAGKHQLYPVDKKFGEAIDLYTTLFPADPALVGVLFKNGQMFYDYGEFDEAIKRFGVIVTKYPDHADAGPAGDRILSALTKAKDYENIEDWARRLKKAKAFAAKDQQERLDRLIVESIGKSGDKYAEAGKYQQAATFYLRVPKEFPDNKLAAQSMMNAGVMYEKAKRPEDAADVYLDLATKYPQSELAEKAAFSAGQVYEKVIYYDRAAKAYEFVFDKFAKGKLAADALFNAGLLRQALGQNDKAIAHYQEYAKRFHERKDAIDVAFNIGVVFEESGDDGHANAAFAGYGATYKSSGKRVIEAQTRAGRTAYRLGQLKKAKDDFAAAQALYKRATGKDKADGKTWAAEARYYEGELVFREYEKVTLDVKPAQLNHALQQKTKLLGDAAKIYLSIADFQDLRWATAALYRVGQVYDGFAEALVNAATPNGLNDAQKQAYRDALDAVVVDIQGKAVEAFSTGYQKAIQMQVYDQYTAKIREALGRLAADKYPPEREGRTRERHGDRPLTPELITEVAR